MQETFFQEYSTNLRQTPNYFYPSHTRSKRNPIPFDTAQFIQKLRKTTYKNGKKNPITNKQITKIL